MSIPTIPDIKPEIDLEIEKVLNLLISSVAMEEMSIANILNSEADKVQAAIKLQTTIEGLIDLNQSTEKLLRSLLKQEMLIQFRLSDVIEFYKLQLENELYKVTEVD